MPIDCFDVIVWKPPRPIEKSPETVVACPIASALVALLAAFNPRAMALLKVELLETPIAIAPAAEAPEFAPTASVFAPAAVADLPIAVAWPKVAVADFP